MKKFLFIITALVATISLSSCNKKELPSSSPSFVSLNLACSLAYDSNITKVAGQDYENKISSMYLFVFNGERLEYSRALSPEEIEARSASIKVRSNATYMVYMVANPTANLATELLSATTKSSFLSKPIRLVDDTILTDGPLMNGFQTINVASSDASYNISLKRFVSRVELKSVENALPAALGDITIKAAYLCNVNGLQNMSSNESNYLVLNKDGVKKGHTVNAPITSAAECDEPVALLYKEFSSGNVISNGSTNTGISSYFYSYAYHINAVPLGYTDPFVATCAELMVVATIGGTDYYYPIPFYYSLLANCNFTVALKIVGYGNPASDPFKMIDKQSYTGNISISDWEDRNSFFPEL